MGLPSCQSPVRSRDGHQSARLIPQKTFTNTGVGRRCLPRPATARCDLGSTLNGEQLPGPRHTLEFVFATVVEFNAGTGDEIPSVAGGRLSGPPPNLRADLASFSVECDLIFAIAWVPER
jgi:hypothetical protein